MNERFRLGTETWYASDSTASTFSVVFEDDGHVAYLYACDRSRDTPILDAIQLYDAPGPVARGTGAVAEVIWSPDGMKAALLLNDWPHAVVDFVSRHSCSRTNWPPAREGWTHAAWDDAHMAMFDQLSG